MVNTTNYETFNPTKRTKICKKLCFLSFSRKCGDKYDKNQGQTEIDAAKTASKRVARKTSEATDDLIGDKIADKI